MTNFVCPFAQLLPMILATAMIGLADPASRAAAPADFAGQYRNDQMSVELNPAPGGSFTGVIHLGANAFPLQAQLDGGQLKGSFKSRGYAYEFTATRSGDQLNLSSGGRTHVLQREDPAPSNPLGGGEPPPPSNPLAEAAALPDRTAAPARPGQGAADPLPGYDLLASAGTGRALFAQKPGIRSAKEGVLSALRDLRQLYDGKPEVSGGFGDTNDKQCQGSFTAREKGQQVKGTVLCGVGENGAAITIVYDRADAPPAEVAALLGALPSPAKWVTHPLPAGSGTIQLPSDWKIKQSTQLGTVIAEGPQGQLVGLGVGAEVVDPRSFIAAQVRANGSMLVAPSTDPVTALRNLAPQLSNMSVRAGGPPIQLNRILTNAPAQAQIPGGQAAWITCSLTKGTGRNAVQEREIALLECYPVGQLAWGLYTSYACGPEATFDRDLPVMVRIAQSWKLNDQAVTSNSRQMIDAQNRRFAAFEDSMKAKNQAFDSYMQSVRNAERVRERSNADFDEIIRGYRTVEDTQTGDRTDVDLGWSKEIVDKLNEKEGFNRYKEIPLRDQ
jgi:hypothetical protein